MTAPEERCWLTLDPKSQPVGPYSIADLTGYAASGLVSEVQVFWREGKPSWDKLSDVPELEPVLKALQQHRASAGAAAAAPAAAAAAPAAPVLQPAAAAAEAAAGLSSPSQAHPHHAVVLTGKPSDALDVFKNAIAAVEAGASDGAAPDADPAAADGAADRAATPEELEFEDDDGTMYRWDHKLRKYVPAAEAADAAAAAQQQHAYDMEAMTFVAEEEVIPTLAAARAAEEAAGAALEGKGEGKRAADKDGTQGKAKKAKGSAAAAAGEAAGDADAEGAAAAAAEAGSKPEEAEEPKGWFELKVNTSVYVTGLPDDTDVDEVAQHFARCGIIKLDDAGQPRIKLYRDRESGMLKGDGLVTYLKEPSVDIACQILDGAPLRAVGPPLSVTVARFEMKGQQYKDKKGGGGKAAAAGSNASKGSGGGRGGGRVGGKGGRGGKKKQFSQAEKQARKLGWGGFDDVLPPERVTVVLKGMFTLDEAAAGGDSFATELETDVAAECSKLGVVEKVRVFASHPQGIITVRFKQEEPAQACLEKMNGRFFGGHQIVAHMWDGFTSYHIKVKEQETAEEQAARLDAFARELEQQQHAAGAAAATADAAAADAAAAGDAVAAAADGVAAAAAAGDDMDVTEAEQAGEAAAAATEAS